MDIAARPIANHLITTIPMQYSSKQRTEQSSISSLEECFTMNGKKL